MLRRAPLISVVVPVYDVEDYVEEALRSILGQDHRRLEVVVVDDGSTDGSGEVAARVAAADDRVRVVRVENRGLGAARNTGVALAGGELLAFADSDDVVPPGAYSTMVARLRRTGAPLVTGNVARLADGAVTPLPWVSRLHPAEEVVDPRLTPDLFGDVFAWNKLWRRDFWDRSALAFPEGVRYEDQPTITEAFLRAGHVAVTPQVVYHWRVRTDGSSITQGRARLEDLRDRWTTKRLTLDAVDRDGTPELVRALLDRVLPADLWRYFELIPEAEDDWWELLVDGVRGLWGERSLTHSVLPPVHRLTGWLVEQGRREDAVRVIVHLRALEGRRVARTRDAGGTVRLDVPGLDAASVAPEALGVHPDEE